MVASAQDGQFLKEAYGRFQIHGNPFCDEKAIQRKFIPGKHSFDVKRNIKIFLLYSVLNFLHIEFSEVKQKYQDVLTNDSQHIYKSLESQCKK